MLWRQKSGPTQPTFRRIILEDRFRSGWRKQDPKTTRFCAFFEHTRRVSYNHGRYTLIAETRGKSDSERDFGKSRTTTGPRQWVSAAPRAACRAGV